MALPFQNAHTKFLHGSRTPPFTQSDGPLQILKIKATTMGLSWGCPNPKFHASFTFHKKSFYAAFENRAPCPCFVCLILRGDGMGLFERLHLPDQVSSALCCGPSCGLPCDCILISTTAFSSRPAVRAACNVGVDAAWRRVSYRVSRPYIEFKDKLPSLAIPILDRQRRPIDPSQGWGFVLTKYKENSEENKELGSRTS